MRAFDVRTGKQLWRFNTIPRPGEFGNETWEENSWSFNGNTGVWTQISVDEELGLAYLPVETPTSDFYGGHRPGNNLFAESLVAVDLKTGERKWHFQFVHHPIWNFDNCCAPLLIDIDVNGKPIKAVAQPSKQAWLYVLDRATGEPVWPIEERPVPQSDVPGEKTSPTQPHPTKPPAYARNYMRVPDDLIDFTPELRQQALEVLKRYKYAPSPFNPPILGNVNGPLLGAHRPRHGHQLAGLRVRSGNHTSCTRRPATCPSRRARSSRRRRASRISGTSGGLGGRAVPRDLRTWGLLRRRLRTPDARRLPQAPVTAGQTSRFAAPATPPAAPRRPPRGGRWRAAASPCRACRSSSRRTACSRRSTSIAARSSGRCRTATRRTTSATTRRSRA